MRHNYHAVSRTRALPGAAPAAIVEAASRVRNGSLQRTTPDRIRDSIVTSAATLRSFIQVQIIAYDWQYQRVYTGMELIVYAWTETSVSDCFFS